MPPQLLEYVIQLRGAQQAATEAKDVAKGVESVGTASRVAGEGAARGSASLTRFGAAMERITRFSSQASGSLRTAGASAEGAAGRFVTAVRRMREAAARPIRIVTQSIGRLVPGSRGAAAVAAGGGGGGGAGSQVQGALASAQLKEFGRGAMGVATTGLLGGILAFTGMKGILDTTKSLEELVIQATALHKVTGMSLNTAAQWLAITQAHGVSNRTLATTFRILSTQVEAAFGKSKKAKDAFHTLGITTSELKTRHRDVNAVLGLVADKFNAMPGGIKKTQLAQQLFGRSWQQLIPILSEGSKGLEEQRKLAAAYGVTLGKDPVANIRKLHQAQVNLKLAQIGLQTQIAEHLAPALLKLVGVSLKVWKFIRENMGPAFKWIGGVIQTVTTWIRQHQDVWRKLGNIVASVWRAIRSAALTAWGVLRTIFRAVVGAALAVGHAALWLAHNVFRPAFRVIGNVVRAAWNLASPLLSSFWKAIKAVGNVIGWLYTNVAKPAFSGLGSVLSAAWTVIKPILSVMRDIFTSIGQAIWWVIQRITSFAQTLSSVVKDVLNAINPLNQLASAFSSVASLLNVGPSSAPFGLPNLPPGAPTGLPGAPTVPGVINQGAGAPPIITHNVAKASTAQIRANTARAWPGGDIVLKVEGRELVRVHRREVIKAMAAGA